MPTYALDGAQNTFGWDYGLMVVRGNVPKMTAWEASGYNPDVSTSFETVWGGSNIYTYPSSAVAMTATSAAGATDNGVAITIIGLDSNYDPLTETVTLAGLGTATTTGSFLRIHRAYVSNGSAPTDTVNITNGGTTYSKITYPYNTSQMCVYTVPRRKRAYLVYASISLEKNKEVVAKLMSRKPNGIFITGGIIGTTTRFDRRWVLPPVFTEKTDIEIRALAGATTSISADMQLLIEDV